MFVPLAFAAQLAHLGFSPAPSGHTFMIEVGCHSLFGEPGSVVQAAPYSNRFWWHKSIQQPYEAGSRAGGGCF